MRVELAVRVIAAMVGVYYVLSGLAVMAASLVAAVSELWSGDRGVAGLLYALFGTIPFLIGLAVLRANRRIAGWVLRSAQVRPEELVPVPELRTCVITALVTLGAWLMLVNAVELTRYLLGAFQYAASQSENLLDSVRNRRFSSLVEVTEMGARLATILAAWVLVSRCGAVADWVGRRAGVPMRREAAGPSGL